MQWLAAGADPKVVQRALGHATAAMTMDLYGHMIDANLWQAARLVGDISGTSEPSEGDIRTDSDPGDKCKKSLGAGLSGLEPPWGIEPPDLRITRSPARRSGHASCTDGSTPAPECPECTE